MSHHVERASTDACTGQSGAGDDAAATCSRAAGEAVFDLGAVVDRVRPAPARLREAAATTCRGMESPTSIATTLDGMAEVDGKPLDERLQEIGAQLAWVRDYL